MNAAIDPPSNIEEPSTAKTPCDSATEPCGRSHFRLNLRVFFPNVSAGTTPNLADTSDTKTMTLCNPKFRILRPSDARIRPWKNGRGQTSEILVLPDGADFLRGDFDVRISRASVIEDGPFSNFAGFDRILVVVAGEGIILDHGDGSGEKLLPKLTAHHFSGDATTTGRLIDGPIEDFNVIVRRGRVRAQIEITDAAAQLIEGPADRLLVHVFRGEFSFTTSSGDLGRLSPGDSLDIEGPPASSAVQLSANDPAARAAIVRTFGRSPSAPFLRL